MPLFCYIEPKSIGLKSIYVIRLIAFWALLNSCFLSAFSQNCPAPAFQPSTQNGVINWQQFPDFTLPFTLIYSGPRLNDTQQTPLRKGFTHLAAFTGADGNLPRANRALLWYGTATGIDQPWDLLESPWANDLNRYRDKWAGEMLAFANLFNDSRGKAFPEADILMADIERHYNTNDSILSLKRRNLVPPPYRQLNDAAFLNRYQRDMQNLYAAPLNYLRENGLSTSTKLTAYADTPIRNTFLNIDGNSWQDWTSNVERVHYLTKDTLTNTVGGSFYKRQDFLLPSAYYLYEYPNPYAGNYLAYLLFQVEANKAWSSKDIIPIVWLRYTGNWINQPIRPWMAEATAIFPFFAEAKGLWLWESPGNSGTNENLANYEYFVQGLYRVSQFKDFFTGGMAYTPKSARDHFADQDPIWRGIIKNNQILIAAHNPYAAENATTTITAEVGNWKQTLTLRGRETLLCTYELPESALSLLDFKPTPNPASNQLTLDIFSSQNRSVLVQLVALSGQTVHEQSISLGSGSTTLPLSVQNLAPGMYLVRLWDGTHSVSKRIVVR